MDLTCTECGSPYTVEQDEQDFHTEMGVPAPTSCPHCRFVRRLAERNARNLHKRKCDLTGKDIFTPYKSVPFPVYEPDAWFGNGWDEMQYGQDIDFSQPFFEQLKPLWNAVPRMGRFICPGTLENCDYTNCIGYCKDCYMTAEADYNEKVMYSNRVFHNNNLIDCSTLYNSELCYECVNCVQCNSCVHCVDTKNSHDCFGMKNCIGCSDCIGCINLRQKQYCIFNEQLTKDEYEKHKEAMQLHTYDGMMQTAQQSQDFWKTQPHKYVDMEQCEASTGDHLYDSKNARHCVDCKDLEDCMYCARTFSVKSAMDYTSWGDRSEKIYFTASSGDNCYNLKFCTTCTTNNTNLEYCGHTTGCKNCFGCVGTRKREYCIFNKQYTEQEYSDLREKLIAHMQSTGEWGQFFPKDFCPYGYNQTIAAEYFPLTKQEALASGYNWEDISDEIPEVEKVIDAMQLPQTIANIPDDILNWAVTCSVSKRPYRITAQELEFYRQMNIPIPRLHPDERHNSRMTRMPSRFFYERQCGKCGCDVRSVYDPKEGETVYCEKCYLEEVY